MKSAKDFVQELVSANEALFEASRIQVKAYFDSNPSKEELVDHFKGRMVNERANLIEISKKVAESTASADLTELQLLSKQALDEAVHFRLVKEVIEHITGEDCDVEAACKEWETRMTNKGASLLEKYNAQDDELALALYQTIAEGRAEVVWTQMSESIEDQFIAGRYAKIARDEGFHSNIGKWKLEQLVQNEEDQTRATQLADRMRKDLYAISAKGTRFVPAAKDLMEKTYNYKYEPLAA